jgi:hypothetical protein
MSDNKNYMELNQQDDSIVNNRGEVILYQPDSSTRLKVLVEEDTVWLTQAQMVDLFETTKQNISLHIRNIIKEGELDELSTVKDYLTVQQEGERNIRRKISLYNLDMIISVGYRVKSQRGVRFRVWATKTLKDYLLKGFVINQRIERIEKQMEKFSIETDKRLTETEKKIDFFVKTSLPPVEGIFYDGQIFNAYVFASDLIKSAKTSLTLIDNYVDESVLLLLSKRAQGVAATIYTAQISPQFQLDLQRHNAQYLPVSVETFTRSHDRFLFIDDEVYHIGASLKDLGKKWFAFSKMGLNANMLLQQIT